jgi:hypothetical protein
LSEKEQVAKKWLDLEARANNSIFLSWLWIGNWLELVNDKLFIVECYQDEKLVGLAFFVERTRKVFGLIPVKQWWLHRTGRQEQDQIWIEYNDFLLSAENENLVREQMVKAISEHTACVDEFVIGLTEDNVLASFSLFFSANRFTGYRELSLSKGYLIDFKLINENYFLEVLSKNARYQINRSEKLLNGIGEVGFKVVSDRAEIIALLPDIANLHIKRWQNTTEGSGFDNAIFTEFHHQFIEESINNSVQVSILTLSEENIGYLVNFVYKDTVYFYLSALSDKFSAKIKLGLLLQTKTIQFYQIQQMNKYDFLAGDAQYKRTMSNISYSLDFICFYKKKTVLCIEAFLRDIKLWLFNLKNR